MLEFKRLALLPAALLLAFTTTYAQKPASPPASAAGLTTRFDQLLQSEFPADGPGCAALVAQKGRIIYQKAVGKANLELDVPLRTDMVFRIGSVTKQFTAAAILKLAEQGKLALDDDLTRFVPDYPTKGKRITIQHLLTHTSGIKSYTSMREWDPQTHRRDFTPDELIGFFQDQPLEFEPGSRWNYSNSGYVLLGYIIEKASGRTYANYLHETFFQPLGLTRTSYEDGAAIVPGRVAGYVREGEGEYRNTAYLSMTQPYAAGSIISTVEDLYKWNKALHEGRVVSKESLKKMTAPYILPDGASTYYGFGLTIGNLLGSPTIEHNGGIHGFNSTLIYLPKEDVCVVALSNCLGQAPDFMASKMAALAAGKEYEVPMIKFDANRLNDYAGVYENGAGEQRLIIAENGQLFSQRTTSARRRIAPIGEDQFQFDQTLARAQFVRENGKVKSVIVSDRQSEGNRWTRTDKPLPAPRQEIQLPAADLEKFTGTYQLQPGFDLVITRQDAQLYAQATGQGRIELYAASPTRFFLKVVPAEIEFKVEADGKVPQLTLFQGGQEMVGKRK
jgi:CubicO group peptidase (beta-lactamase class C family)